MGNIGLETLSTSLVDQNVEKGLKVEISKPFSNFVHKVIKFIKLFIDMGKVEKGL